METSRTLKAYYNQTKGLPNRRSTKHKNKQRYDHHQRTLELYHICRASPLTID